MAIVGLWIAIASFFLLLFASGGLITYYFAFATALVLWNLDVIEVDKTST